VTQNGDSQVTVLSGGEAIARAVLANGVDTVFGLPGAQIYPLFDALHRLGARILTPRHEQTAAYMAYGAAKSTGRPAAFAVVPGPGVLNAGAALVTAMGACAPVLCLTGQIPSQYLGRGRGHLHELKDQPATLRTLIKDAMRIDDPTGTSALVNSAFRKMRSDRPGPVSVEMCWDTMAASWEVDIDAADRTVEKPDLDPDQIGAAARLIADARKPMIMCGAGAQHAAAEVRALAERLQAPVTAFRSGRGVVAEDHALGVAAVAARELFDDVDVLIGVGSRLEMIYMRWRDMNRYEQEPGGGPTLIRIDIDPREMERLRPDAGIVADAADGCRALLAALEPAARHDPHRREEIADAKARAAAMIEKIQPQVSYLKVIREVLPRDGFFVPEVSQMGFTSYFGFPVLEPRTYVTEGYQGTLGFGFPTALGVKAAHPASPVVSVTGDGGFMFAVQELATAAAHGLAVVTLLFNNNAFGNVRRDQRLAFNGRLVGADLTNPDFVALAESFGIAARRVATPEALRPALESALAADRPALIEVTSDADEETSPWEFIMMAEKPSARR
jgi:acetolactate synthase I/II/III large subunit